MLLQSLTILNKAESTLKFFRLLSEQEKKPTKEFHREHGLQLPFDSHQVFAWLLTGFPCICFFSFQYQTLTSNYRYFFTILFLIFYFMGVVLFLYATLERHPYIEQVNPDTIHFCKYCCKNVPNTSKHCRMCNKCRIGFDHHCRYINNCVTISNYNQFYFGTLSFVLAGVLGIVSIVLVMNAGTEVVISRISSVYSIRLTKVWYWVAISIALLLNLGLVIPLLVLVYFHVLFQSKNITTFDYIINSTENFPVQLQSFACSNEKISSFRI